MVLLNNFRLPHDKFPLKIKRSSAKLYFLVAAVASFVLYMSYIVVKNLSSIGPVWPTQVEERVLSDCKVRLDIYIESLCPDTTDFVQNQLWPNWAKVKDLAHTRIYPYGKVYEKSFNTKDGDDFEFQCQHGPKECTINQMMSCAMEKFNSRPELYLPFIVCMQQGNPSLLNECASKSDLNAAQIQQCADSVEGRRLHSRMGAATNALKPPLFYVPWVVLNGERDETATDDLIAALCRKYKGDDRDQVCRR